MTRKALRMILTSVTTSAILISMLFIASFAMASAPQPEAVPGEYLVKLKPSIHMTISDLSVFLNSTVKEIISSNLVVIQRSVVEKRAAVLESLAENPAVEIVEPNFIYRAFNTPNDTEFSRLWGMSNIGQKDSSGAKGVEGVDINATQAWDITTGSRDIIVAVIDTGVDPKLADLKDNMWVNEAELNGTAGVDDDGNGYVDDIHGYDFVNSDGDPTDDHGHGSHVSGTIGGKGNDGHGVAGVNWTVRIMGLKFLSASGGGTLENAVKAIDYARTMGANILSNSWGGGGFSQILKDAIIKTNEANELFIAAAGNDGKDNDARPSYPANYDVPNVISVAAVDNRGSLAGFSNYGKKTVHIGAPGVNILSTTPGGFKSWSGTSMACPHVAGVAALVWGNELGNESELTALEVKERLLKTVSPLKALKNKTTSGGMVNAFYAVTDTLAPKDPNDPDGWKSEPIKVSTVHPYAESFKKEWTVQVPGAKRLAVYFERFETERGYDKVEFFDAVGQSVGVMSGVHDGEYSPFVEGDTMILKFQSDKTVQKYGFDVNKVAFE